MNFHFYKIPAEYIRNITIWILSAVVLTFYSCNPGRNKAADTQEWQVLFNGKDLEGWIPKLHHHEVGENYANTFRVHDGVIQVNYDEYDTFDERYGHLFYKEPFSSYHLKFDYRFTDQWMEDAPLAEGWPTGITRK
jgi:hypothetical protein